MPDRADSHPHRCVVPVRLRPHHLLCLLTFAGAGYSAEFITNFRAIVERIGRGTPVALIAGPDEICAGLQTASDSAHCATGSVARRDAVALGALARVAGFAELIAAGSEIVLDAQRVDDMRARFATGELRAACAGCEWSSLCTTIADDDFVRTALAGAARAAADAASV